MVSLDKMIASYSKHKNLKLSAAELGMPFQTLYYRLRNAGVRVTGDKERYGTEKDRFAARCEAIFKSLVPDAKDQNDHKFQAKIDFMVHGIPVDVKGAAIQIPYKGRNSGHRWMFSIKRQKKDAVFFVMFGFESSASPNPAEVFLIPSELIEAKTTISISCYGKSKWHAYRVGADELSEIFKQMIN